MSERIGSKPPASQLDAISANLAAWQYPEPDQQIQPDQQLEPTDPIEHLIGDVDLSNASERQVRRIVKLGQKLGALSLTAEVHAESPDATQTYIPIDKPKFGGPSPRTQYRKSFAQYRESAQPIMQQVAIREGLEPITLSERRQDARNARRQAKANELRSGRQYRLKKVYGSNVGTPDFEESIESTRIAPMQRRRAKGAHKKFKRIEKVAMRQERRVGRSATREDIPGIIIKQRIDRTQRKLDKVLARVSDPENNPTLAERIKGVFQARTDTTSSQRNMRTQRGQRGSISTTGNRERSIPPRPSRQNAAPVDRTRRRKARTEWGKKWQEQQEVNRKGVI